MSINSRAQTFKVDTVIYNGVVHSYFSYDAHNPLYVKYKLYQGGGECNRTREGFRFFVDTIPNKGLDIGKKKHQTFPKNSATSNDYAGSGYDIGHLASAEDFAYDCKLEAKTFRFYNALPQTPNLNRGIWKKYETEIRKLSAKDSLMIFCGGIFGNNSLPQSNVLVPDYCWKVVFSLTTKKPVYILWFTNLPDKNSVKTMMTLKEIEKAIGLHLTF